MELEAIRNALKAVKDMKAPPTIIVATDSIHCKIQSGYLLHSRRIVRPPWRSPNRKGDMGLCTRPLWSHLQWDRWHVGFELLQLNSTWLVPFWHIADENKVMERSAHHIHPILRRRTPPHLPWNLTWIITLQHQGRTCQSNPQPTAHWQHLLLHSFDAFVGAGGWWEDQCSSTSSVNPLSPKQSGETSFYPLETKKTTFHC